MNIPDDAISPGWDWVMQDTSEFRDKSTTCRVPVMSHGVDSVLHNPPKNDTKGLAEFLSQMTVFGGGTAVGINDSPYRVKGTPDQLWRMDYREEIVSTKISDHVFRRSRRRRTRTCDHRPDGPRNHGRAFEDVCNRNRGQP